MGRHATLRWWFPYVRECGFKSRPRYFCKINGLIFFIWVVIYRSIYIIIYNKWGCDSGVEQHGSSSGS